MNKTEFLRILRETLSGGMEEGKASAHVRYYQDYIQRQADNGRSEEDILRELGDPRLIAKTLLDTDQGAKSSGAYEENRTPREYRTNTGGTHGRRLDLSTWYGKALVIFLAVLAILALLLIAGILIPIFLLAAAAAFIISFLKRRS